MGNQNNNGNLTPEQKVEAHIKSLKALGVDVSELQKKADEADALKAEKEQLLQDKQHAEEQAAGYKALAEKAGKSVSDSVEGKKVVVKDYEEIEDEDDKLKPEVEEEYEFDFSNADEIVKEKASEISEVSHFYIETAKAVFENLRKPNSKKAKDAIRGIVDDENKIAIRAVSDRNIFEQILIDYNTAKRTEEGVDIDSLESKWIAKITSDFAKYPELLKTAKKKVGFGFERLFNPLFLDREEEERKSLLEWTRICSDYARVVAACSDFSFVKKIIIEKNAA